jgi:trimeric autotransporter adhesin
MSKAFPIVNISTDSFLSFITKVNNIITFANTEIVSANSTGGVTNGIGFVNGTFGANTLAASEIRGGNSTVLGSLNVEANTIEAFEYAIVGANVGMNTTTIFVGNSTVNVRITSTTLTGNANAQFNKATAFTDLTVGNSTVNTFINSSSITVNVANFTTAVIDNVQIGSGFEVATGTFTTRANVGANVWINTSAIHIGNSTANIVINSTAISGSFNFSQDILSTNTLNAAVNVLVGGNVAINTSTYFVGNSTANVRITSSAILGGPNAVFNVVTIEDLSISSFTIPEIAIGDNVSLNSSILFIGNSSVNATLNSSMLKVNGVNTLTVEAGTSLAVGANLIANATAYRIGNSTVNVVITQAFINGSPNAALNVVNVGTVNATSLVGAGANVRMNLTSFFVGNSTVNTVITQSAITGAPNAELNVVNSVTSNATTLMGVGANVGMNTTAHYVGNSTVNTVITQSAITGSPNAALNVVNVATVNATTLVGAGANVGMNTTTHYVGNSTVNVVINSSAIVGTPNAALNIVNAATVNATTLVGAGANVGMNTTAHFVGNSTVNAVINSTSIKVMNSTVNSTFTIPTAAQYAGSFFLKADGTWAEVSGSVPDDLVTVNVTATNTLRVSTGTANMVVNTTVLLYQNSTQTRLLVAANGNVGIGNGTPTNRLSVTGNVWASGELIAASDAAFKEEIEYLSPPEALKTVRKLKGSKYYMKDDASKKKRKRYGLIAQDVEKVIPELVSGKKGHKGLSYMGMIPILIEAVKELSAEIEKLKNDRKSE